MKPARVIALSLAAFVWAAAVAPLKAAETRISIGVTETMETFNPYGDSVSLMYSVWCMVLGCLGTYDFDKGQHVGLLVEKWEVKDPKTWLFHLRKDNRFHDGSPVTAEDVVHSLKRTRSDPFTKQFQNVSAVASEAVVDKYTVRITTKEPTAPLLDYLFDRIIITSKAIYDKYGADVADRQHPVGAGPYKFRELIPGQRLVIGKDKTHPMWKQYPQAPDEIVFRLMREPEQRVTALLNNEIQIAQFIPPHLAERVSGAPNAALLPTSSVEIMFLALSPKYKPWDNVQLRQAVCYTIDKEVTEAMIPMLNAVGINARLRTPEWATLWADVQKGKTPFYYMGRGSVVDPSVALSQYFETGGSPRIGISDPKIDQTLAAERVTFDPADRRKALNAEFKAIEEAAPACFMWRHHMLYGESKNIEHKPTPSGRIFGTDIIVKQ